MISHALLDIGPSGSGKSHLAKSALDYYGSGVVVLARGMDELNSYYPLFEDKEHYDFAGFDDPDFQVVLGKSGGGLNAHGAADVVRYLGATYTRLKAEYDSLGEVRSRKVLVVDTGSALGSLAMNAALAKFGYEEPPPVIGERGYPFFSYLMAVQQGIFSKMRAIRGLGVHWIVTAQAAEKQITEGQAVANEGMLKKQIMAAFPGGFRDVVQQFFDLVVQSQVIPIAGKPPMHRLLWTPDPRRVTKSRWGDLGALNLPNEWLAILPKLDELARLKDAGASPVSVAPVGAIPTANLKGVK